MRSTGNALFFCDNIANIGKIFVANNGSSLQFTVLNSTTNESNKTIKSPRNIYVFFSYSVQFNIHSTST